LQYELVYASTVAATISFVSEYVGEPSDLMNLLTSKDWMPWYESLAKPNWTPAPGTIGLIWSILYPVIIVSFGFVLVQAVRGKVPPRVALPFVINLAANLVFTPIQFGLRNLPLATVDILVVWGTIVWAVVAVRRYYPWVAWAQLPYFVWVSIATTLQISITAMNWGRA